MIQRNASPGGQMGSSPIFQTELHFSFLYSFCKFNDDDVFHCTLFSQSFFSSSLTCSMHLVRCYLTRQAKGEGKWEKRDLYEGVARFGGRAP
jgi:hypothetical protein